MVAPRCSVQTHSVARRRRRVVAPHRSDVVDRDRVIAIVAKHASRSPVTGECCWAVALIRQRPRRAGSGRLLRRLMCRWFVNVPWLLGIDVVHM
jgi:hypothetical protein